MQTDLQQRRSANRSIWRWIIVTAFLSLLVVGATSISLRALAQQQDTAPPPVSPTAPAEPAPAEPAPEGDDESNEIEPRPDAAAPRPPANEPPELRESADNNLSFPVDI